DWVEFRLDLGELADNKAVLQVGLGIESEDAGTSYGWNLDEIIVKDSTQPDYLECGGCVGAPTFGGVTAAFDPDPCGPSGLMVTWDAAPAWGSGGAGTYDVHRGLTPGFLPDAGNRVATGLTALSWLDNGAPVDTPVWYIVRARNDESCSGGEGEPDTNLVRLSATETLDQSVPVPIDDSVRLFRVGGAHVRLSWDPIAGADHYVIQRSGFPDFTAPVEVGTTSLTFFEDTNAASSPGFYSYRVLAVNACGEAAP
ncbi:MAG: hypothetical protein R3344_14515, partial [Acidobacteriota bacterium]|nr:hypothetical protein [Acidobacteriota bacterium]